MVVVGLHADAFGAANALILIGNLIVIFAGLFIAAVLWQRACRWMLIQPWTRLVYACHADALDAQAKLLARVRWYQRQLPSGLASLLDAIHWTGSRPWAGSSLLRS